MGFTKKFIMDFYEEIIESNFSKKKLFEMSVVNSVIYIVNDPRVCGFPTHNSVIFHAASL